MGNLLCDVVAGDTIILSVGHFVIGIVVLLLLIRERNIMRVSCKTQQADIMQEEGKPSSVSKTSVGFETYN